jgi:hypothetical protein
VAEAFQGTKGTIETNDAGVAYVRDYAGNVLLSSDMKGGVNPYQQEHNELFKSIRNKEVINNAEYGAKSTMSAIIGRMATYSGKVINWDEAMNSNHQIMPETVTWETTPPSLPDQDGLYPIPTPGVTKVL